MNFKVINQHGVCWSVNPSNTVADWDENGALKQNSKVFSKGYMCKPKTKANPKGATGGLKLLLSMNTPHQMPIVVNNFLDGGFRVKYFHRIVQKE